MRFIPIVFLFFPLSSLAFNVVIDPGHGGKDHGARRASLREADLTLTLAQDLRDLLVDEPDVQVYMTRERDEFVSLKERVEIADQRRADLLLSIHANTSPDPRARGTEFYIQNQLPPDEETWVTNVHELSEMRDASPGPKVSRSSNSQVTNKDLRGILDDLQHQSLVNRSERWSRLLAANWKAPIPLGHNAIRQAPFYLVTRAPAPSVLVEVGYLSHARDAAPLAQQKSQKQLAEVLAQAVHKYKELLDRDRANSPVGPLAD
jgi:N-acetylmuramoyl-L-alanine amidase